ncbi:hypothetical protein CALCODRAFT_199067 [Calocera cornea HHB12733]|uniref:Uncharacterized protein n=1 Tax=Calocera cornea HHB12733 TaxID=1353952 RepID=A0A165HGA9_9BASI|nr:hypothetical protein CALCODRAFT_199067 [Calocera cornea HHB12733]
MRGLSGGRAGYRAWAIRSRPWSVAAEALCAVGVCLLRRQIAGGLMRKRTRYKGAVGWLLMREAGEVMGCASARECGAQPTRAEAAHASLPFRPSNPPFVRSLLPPAPPSSLPSPLLSYTHPPLSFHPTTSSLRPPRRTSRPCPCSVYHPAAAQPPPPPSHALAHGAAPLLLGLRRPLQAQQEVLTAHTHPLKRSRVPRLPQGRRRRCARTGAGPLPLPHPPQGRRTHHSGQLCAQHREQHPRPLLR